MEAITDTSLHKMCFYGTEQEIISLLEAGGDVNMYNEDGYTPLHIAVQRPDHLVCVVTQLLVSRGADVNAITLGEGETCLHLLARFVETRQAVDVALTLLLSKADPSLRNRKLRTAYDYAISKNKDSLADVLCPDVRTDSNLANDDLLNLEDMKKNATEANLGAKLIRAVINGNKEDTNTYIKNGANPDFINENGAGAIHYAVSHCPTDRVDFITILIEGGANVNLQDHEGDTALNLAIKMHKGRPAVETETIVTKLLQLGANKTMKDADGRDAKDVAKHRNLSNILSLLGDTTKQLSPTKPKTPTPSPPKSPVKSSVPPKTPIQPQTPTYPKSPVKPKTPTSPKSPVKPKTPTSPKSPVKPKTPITPKTPVPNTVDDAIDDVDEIKPWGDDPNKRNDDGKCPIHEIVGDKSSNEDDINAVLPLLIEDGADIDAKVIHSGDTALHIATSRGMVTVVRKLLDLGANECIENKTGKIPYDVAMDSGFNDIAEILKNRMVARGKWQKATKKAKNCAIL